MEMREAELSAEMSTKERTIPVPYSEFIDFIQSKEKLESIRKLYKKSNYPEREVKILLDIEEEKNESTT